VKKVLILAYFFPPCNLPASQRSYSWAKYFYKYGYYPVIITRRWDKKINTQKDLSAKSEPNIIHKKYSTYEVFYLPYKQNLRDKIYTKYGDKRFVFLRKLLSFVEILLQNITNRTIPYRNIYKFSLQYIKDNNLDKNRNKIKKIIITGNPFILYKFGYLLNKKLGTKWIADYRDPWTTSETTNINKNFLYKLLIRIDSYFEKKWVNTASVITSVSKSLTDKISNFVKTHGEVIYNGLVLGDFDKYRTLKPFDIFTISYIGTLYNDHKIEIFCNALKKLINSTKNPKIRVLFPGLAYDKYQRQRIEQIMKGYEKYYKYSGRTDREKILEIEVKSHLLLYVAWENFGGVPCKIYEYIASKSYILVTPTDNSSVENIINKSKCGIITNTVDETYIFLKKVYQKYLQGIKLGNDIEKDNIKQFSRELQVKKLADILEKI